MFLIVGYYLLFKTINMHDIRRGALVDSAVGAVFSFSLFGIGH